MNKRVLILTGAMNDPSIPSNVTEKDCLDIAVSQAKNDGFVMYQDNKMVEVFDLTLPSKQRYCKKHGYDLLSLRSFGDGEIYGFKESDIGFLRAARSFEMLKVYDIVMWLDADAIITNDIPLDDFPIEEKTFCASYDWAWKESFSTGNCIIQRTQESHKFFEVFLQLGRQCSGRKMQDQEVLNYMDKHTPLKNTMKSLEHKFLNAVPSFITETPTWKADNNRTGIVSPWDEHCFLAHLTGCTNYDRIVLLNDKFSDFL